MDTGRDLGLMGDDDGDGLTSLSLDWFAVPIFLAPPRLPILLLLNDPSKLVSSTAAGVAVTLYFLVSNNWWPSFFLFWNDLARVSDVELVVLRRLFVLLNNWLLFDFCCGFRLGGTLTDAVAVYESELFNLYLILGYYWVIPIYPPVTPPYPSFTKFPPLAIPNEFGYYLYPRELPLLNLLWAF